MDINNLSQQQLDYLKFLKKNWVDKNTAFSKLEENTMAWKFWNTGNNKQEETTWTKILNTLWDTAYKTWVEPIKRLYNAWKW